MNIHNYDEEIAILLECNPDLSPENIGLLLTADSLYKSVPEDLAVFRDLYVHMDPLVEDKNHDKLMFLKLVKSSEPTSIIKQRINSYINIKFNDISHLKTYEQNMQIFKEYSKDTSAIIDGVLSWAAFPEKLVRVLKEKDEVKNCFDFYCLIDLYKSTEDSRVKFEILRKLGLIILIARINRSVIMSEMEGRMLNVWKALRKRLGYNSKKKNSLYFWLDSSNKVRFSESRKTALRYWDKDMKKRQCIALKKYPMQKFTYNPFRTLMGNEIIHMEIRNKMLINNEVNFTSYVEKMIRKNLEFPSQVRDIVGVKIVVRSENDIQNIIEVLESFLGGSSTRKKEKNSYHKFGRRSLSKYSSKDYFVWKAIYDMTLPHSELEHIKKIMALTKDNRNAQEELKKRYGFLVNNPKDFLIEVQLQDMKSYLQSIVHGSPTAHAVLKKTQIRSSSFYKFFPKEIYENDVLSLKNQTVCS